MAKKSKRKVIYAIEIILCLIISLVIAFVPNFFSKDKVNMDNKAIYRFNEKEILDQDIVNNTDKRITYNKLYYKGQLIGVIDDLNDFDAIVDSYYVSFEDKFPNSSLGLTEDLYIVEEDGYISFENINKEIVDYLYKNDLLGIKCHSIELANDEGIYDIIYVSDIEDFYSARNSFLLNFTDEDTLQKIRNSENISSPTEFGTSDMSIQIHEKITFSEAIVNPEYIFSDVNSIYSYLCYGRKDESEFQYYTTVEGDTIQAVGYHFGDMSAKQIVMLNSEVLSDENQVIMPGTRLNVTYFDSPITVEVKKHRLTQVSVLPDSPIYQEDPSLNSGTRKIRQEEKNGIANVLYEERWINGVIQGGDEISRDIVEEPIQGIIAVGTFVLPDVGTGNWGWPTNNPHLTCDFYCYAGHGGIDIQDRYNHWSNVLAIDAGTVSAVGYSQIGGYYVKVNHNNGYETYYGHMRTYPWVSVGQTVARGEVLGPIGMTGFATGPHVHLQIYKDGTNLNPCSVLACTLINN